MGHGRRVEFLGRGLVLEQIEVAEEGPQGRPALERAPLLGEVEEAVQVEARR